jgi:hypothetical protein
LSGTFAGVVDEIDLLDYQYKNLKLEGIAKSGMIQATASMDDVSLKFELSGSAHLTETSPSVDFTLDLAHADLQALHLIDQKVTLKGLATGTFESTDPDSLNGSLDLRNLTLTDSARTVGIDSIHLLATASQDSNTLEITTGFLEMRAYGKYQLTALASAFMQSMDAYFNSSRDSVSKPVADQRVQFEGEISFSPIFNQLDTNLRNFAPITLKGNYNSNGDMIELDARTDLMHYGPAKMTGILTEVETQDGALQYKLSWDAADFESLQLQKALITGTVRDNLIQTDVTLKDSDEKERFFISGQTQPLDSTLVISLNPRKLLLNYDDWIIDGNNEITIASSGLGVQDFVLTYADQRMSVRSDPPGIGNPLALEFNQFKIETIAEIFSRDSLLAGGIIEGTATARNVFESPVFTADLNISDFNFHGDTIGNIRLAIDNETPATLSASMEIEGGGNRVDVKGRYFIQTEQIDLAMHIDRLLLASAQAFSVGQISQAAGSVRGDLNITGSIAKPMVEGDLHFDSASVFITELKGVYELEDEGVRFTNSDIHFDNFTITDEENNDLTIDGVVYTNTFTRFGFNLDIQSRNFKVLNTDSRDNELYFGTLYLDSRITVRGDMGAPEVNADLTVLDNTNLTVIIPQEAPGIVEREGVVRFVDLDNPQLDSVLALDLDTLNTFSLKGMVLFSNIKVTDESEFKLVIDQGNGDFLSLKGNAELNASVDPSGKISLTGNYILKEGIYELSFNFLKRRFDIRKGSKITWNGEPTSGALDITAAYVVDAPPIDLVERQLGDATQAELNLYKERLPFELILSLTGTLTKPEVSFDIELPEGNYPVAPEVISNVQTKLEQIRRDEAELNKQAFALVLLNRFLADVPFKNVSGGSSAELYARQSVSKLLSQQLNNLAGGLINGVDLNFDIESTEDYSTGQLKNRTDLAVSASKRLLDDRITITVGSNFELEGTGQANEKASNIAGDLVVEYQLSRDGRYLLKAYRKNEYEVAVEGQVVKTGVSFVIQMDYNKFRELFQKKDKDKN